jgi:hypothetical protein
LSNINTLTPHNHTTHSHHTITPHTHTTMAMKFAKMPMLMVERTTRNDTTYTKTVREQINPQSFRWIKKTTKTLIQFLSLPSQPAHTATVQIGWPDAEAGEATVPTVENKNQVLKVFTQYIEEYMRALEQSLDKLNNDDRFDNIDFWTRDLQNGYTDDTFDDVEGALLEIESIE